MIKQKKTVLLIKKKKNINNLYKYSHKLKVILFKKSCINSYKLILYQCVLPSPKGFYHRKGNARFSTSSIFSPPNAHASNTHSSL